MPIPLTALQTTYDRRRKTRRYTSIATGAYTTGGVAIDFSTVANPSFEPDVFLGKVPGFDELFAQMPDGYSCQFVPGTDPTQLALAWKLKIFTAPATELAAAAFPAPLLADSILIDVNQRAWAN